jgi:hypothetical protein
MILRLHADARRLGWSLSLVAFSFDVRDASRFGLSYAGQGADCGGVLVVGYAREGGLIVISAPIQFCRWPHRFHEFSDLTYSLAQAA